MVVRRPAYNVNGFELCGLVNGPEVIMRTRSSSTSGLESFLPKRSDKSKRNSAQEKRLKFKGWIGLEDVELLDGSGDLLPSFMLQTNATSMSAAAAKQPASPTVAANMALENYFLEQPLRLFSTSPPQEEVPITRSQISAHTQKKEEFCKQFHKSKAILNQNGESPAATPTHREMPQVPLYTVKFNQPIAFDRFHFGYLLPNVERLQPVQ